MDAPTSSDTRTSARVGSAGADGSLQRLVSRVLRPYQLLRRVLFQFGHDDLDDRRADVRAATRYTVFHAPAAADFAAFLLRRLQRLLVAFRGLFVDERPSGVQVASAIESLVSVNAPRVAVDLADVSFIDSTGVAALCLGQAKLEANGGVLVLGPVSPRVQSVLQMTGLDASFVFERPGT